MLGTDQKFSTVGISFGLDVIYTAISAIKKMNQEESSIDYYIIPINSEIESLKVAEQLRERGYNVEMELGKKKLGKLMEKANKERFPSVSIIGEEEIKLNQIKIKEIKSGQERTDHFKIKLWCIMESITTAGEKYI
ncbi:His/Gly/Thr/Pro-type tRNA ligase C-terminal domain-containing protein [Robertmurraya sp. FSL R5-0851]|uniref:His/Gly/Thr/Pro-type tRNA ligase C-terminal domain-containing protein n=1 Tax=Robertmurraya sp. FSL R5-0851 TaxID=2921584 RepID=UPI0030F78BA5